MADHDYGGFGPLFELDGVSVQTAKEALDLAAAKLPIKTRFVARVGA